MAELKTKHTNASVGDYLNAIEDPQRRQDCIAIAAIMHRVTGHEPRMWGRSIVGFGSYRYEYASGHEGDACLVGFSSRRSEVSLYLMLGMRGRGKLLDQLGKHKAGKGCLYIKRLSGINVPVLETLIAESISDIRRHGGVIVTADDASGQNPASKKQEPVDTVRLLRGRQETHRHLPRDNAAAVKARASAAIRRGARRPRPATDRLPPVGVRGLDRLS